MPRTCRCRERSTPLARYAERLAASDVEEVALEPMLFPMYTVPMEVALKMTCVEPYEELVKKGLLVEFLAPKRAVSISFYLCLSYLGTKETCS